MKFLVTGATGFIGKRVVKQLLNKNITVIASDVRIDEEQKYFFEYLNLLPNSLTTTISISVDFFIKLLRCFSSLNFIYTKVFFRLL